MIWDFTVERVKIINQPKEVYSHNLDILLTPPEPSNSITFTFKLSVQYYVTFNDN